VRKKINPSVPKNSNKNMQGVVH